MTTSKKREYKDEWNKSRTVDVKKLYEHIGQVKTLRRLSVSMLDVKNTAAYDTIANELLIPLSKLEEFKLIMKKDH